jgi:hypothetical protein
MSVAVLGGVPGGIAELLDADILRCSARSTGGVEVGPYIRRATGWWPRSTVRRDPAEELPYGE